MPWVTWSVCPRAWECHAVRAPGANRTFATSMRCPSSRGEAIGSSQTSPVNRSGGFLVVGAGGRTSMRASSGLGDVAAEGFAGDRLRLGAAAEAGVEGVDRGELVGGEVE